MININDLIQNVCRRVGIVSDNQPVSGTKASIALDYLNSVIQDLNTQEYLADNIKIFKFTASGIITIGNHASCNVVSEPPPTIKHFGRKVGTRYVRLYKSNLEGIFGTNNGGIPSLYNYRVEYDPEKECLVGIITMNGSASQEFVLTFPAPIHDVTMNDDLPVQNIYKNVLEAGLAVELVKHYKMLELLEMYDNDFIDAKDKIKTLNSGNRPIVWDDMQGSYMDSYYAGFYGEGL